LSGPSWKALGVFESSCPDVRKMSLKRLGCSDAVCCWRVLAARMTRVVGMDVMG